MSKILISFILLINFNGYSQGNSLFDRVQAIKTDNYLTFYNVDGYSITTESMIYSFKESPLSIAYRTYNVSDELKKKDSIIKYENYTVKNSIAVTDSITQYNSYYFIKNIDEKIIVIQFSVVNKVDEFFERKFIDLIIENKIPPKCYNEHLIKKINFASRKIELNDCYYTTVNSVQCPYNGQMNWSLHQNIEDAKNQIKYQAGVTKSHKKGEIINDELVDIVFEGIETKARKVIYDFTNSDISAAVSAESLIIYYVAVKVRNNYVSCILSHWNNDNISESGLPLLFNKVMSLK